MHPDGINPFQHPDNLVTRFLKAKDTKMGFLPLLKQIRSMGFDPAQRKTTHPPLA